MKPDDHPTALCSEIAGELRDITRWLAGGEMSPEHFRLAVETLEERKVARHGFDLISAVDPSGTATFTLRFADTLEVCTSLEVDPRSGEITEHAPACES